jgi:DNA repair protein RadC
VISADPRRLMAFDGVKEMTATTLKIIQAAAQRLAQRQVQGRSVVSSWQALLDYCRSKMAHRDTEAIRVLFLDSKNGVIADEEQGAGTVNQAPVYPREVVKRALELGAVSLILVHNHPSGDPTPSRMDVEMTKRVAEAARTLGVALHDHVVIGRNGHYSFRANGLI